MSCMNYSKVMPFNMMFHLQDLMLAINIKPCMWILIHHLIGFQLTSYSLTCVYHCLYHCHPHLEIQPRYIWDPYLSKGQKLSLRNKLVALRAEWLPTSWRGSDYERLTLAWKHKATQEEASQASR